MNRTGGNFLTAHYEWIAAAVALIALAVGGYMLFDSMGTDSDEIAAESVARVKALRPGGAEVKKADLTEYNRALKGVKSPAVLADLGVKNGSFLSSEPRMFCEQCHAPVPTEGKVCPACKFERKEEAKVVVDADGDGMPDEWEKRYGLNPNDPSDAQLDKDGDAFTNLEEYEAKTDPTDRTAHPDYLDSLQLMAELKETTLPFSFTGAYKTPSGMKFQFKDPSRAAEYDRGVYSVLAGEEIGKSGFSAKEYVEKTEKRKMGGGMVKSVDVSEAIVVRKSDGKTVAMTINRRGIPVDVQAKLVYTRGEQKTFDVVAGDTIDLSGTKYVIKAITRKPKGASISISHSTLGKIRVLDALER